MLKIFIHFPFLPGTMAGTNRMSIHTPALNRESYTMTSEQIAMVQTATLAWWFLRKTDL